VKLCLKKEKKKKRKKERKKDKRAVNFATLL
jgi:hypothetical protein